MKNTFLLISSGSQPLYSMQQNSFVFAASLYLLSVVGLFAQVSGTTARTALPEVLVTGSTDQSLLSPSPQTAADTANITPGAVNVVTPEEYNLGCGAYLSDFLNYQPGLFIESDQGSEDNKVSIRGSGIQNDDISGLEVLVEVRTGDMGNRLTGDMGDTKEGGYALERSVIDGTTNTICEPGRERAI